VQTNKTSAAISKTKASLSDIHNQYFVPESSPTYSGNKCASWEPRWEPYIKIRLFWQPLEYLQMHTE